MDSMPDIDVSRAVSPEWVSAFAAVNRWRGECMHHFSSVEMAVTETLLALDAAKPVGATIRLRYFIGEKFGDLETAVGESGPFGTTAKSASQALAYFRENHENFRSALCHGVTKVTLERNGKWLLVIRILAIKKRGAESGVRVFEQLEAEAKLTALKRDGQKLCATLGQLRKTFASKVAR
jgi:hypothetical protein